MAPKGARVKSTGLKNVMPTEDEIKEATAIINPAKDPKIKERQCMASMTHWLKTEGIQHNVDASESRGPARKAFLMKFMVMQGRNKKAHIEQSTNRITGTENRKILKSGYYSYEGLAREVGKAKLDMWIDNDLIYSEVDKRSKKEEREFRDYWYEAEEHTTTDVDHTRTNLGTTSTPESVEAAMQQLNSISASSTDDNGGGTDTIKTEAVDEKTPFEKQLAELRNDPASFLQKWNNIVVTVKTWRGKASGVEFQESYMAALDKYLPTLEKSTNMLSAMASGHAFSAEKVPDLLRVPIPSTHFDLPCCAVPCRVVPCSVVQCRAVPCFADRSDQSNGKCSFDWFETVLDDLGFFVI